MKPVRRAAVLLLSSVLGASVLGSHDVWAHHSFALYDMSAKKEVSGTVSKFEWTNPHSWLFVSVPSTSGATVYGFEMVSVGQLVRQGWRRTSVKPGDKVTVVFHQLKNGSPDGLLVAVKDANGAEIGKLQVQ